MKRWWWVAGLVLLLGVAAGLFFVGRDTDPAARFETAEVVAGTLEDVIVANGTVNPVRVVNVGSQVSGTVEKLFVDFNDRVRAGQVLLELDARLFRARLAQSEAALANARAQAALAAANERRAAELRRQEYISVQDHEQAIASARSAAAQVASAEAAVAQDRANLGFSIIRAPVSGIITNRKIDIGQTVAASFQTPELFTIAENLGQMRIEALVAEADVARVRPGQTVRFTVDAHPGRQFLGRAEAVRLNPTVQQNVVTFTVEVLVDNPDGALLPGMTANAEFLVTEHRDRLLVPNAALSFRPKDFVPARMTAAELAAERRLEGTAVTLFVLGADGRPEPRRVRLGASDQDNALLVGGELKAGERVILRVADPDRPGGPTVRARPA